VGNFAVAGHRATKGEPFRKLDRMRRGDAIVVETRTTWLTYVVDDTRIVTPQDTWVVNPVPGKRNVKPTKRLLTLTTCHPRWASTHRMIVFAHLESKKSKKDGAPAALMASGG
jgi:sortase A